MLGDLDSSEVGSIPTRDIFRQVEKHIPINDNPSRATVVSKGNTLIIADDVGDETATPERWGHLCRKTNKETKQT